MTNDIFTIFYNSGNYQRDTKYSFFVSYAADIVCIDSWEWRYKWLADGGIAVRVCGTATGAESCISPRDGQGCCWKTRLRAVYRACEYGVRPRAGTLALGLRQEPDYAPG